MLPPGSRVSFVKRFVIMALIYLIVYCVEWKKDIPIWVLEPVNVILLRKGSLQM